MYSWVYLVRVYILQKFIYNIWHEILTEKLIWWIGGHTYMVNERTAKLRIIRQCVIMVLEMQCIHLIEISPPNYERPILEKIAILPNITPANISCHMVISQNTKKIVTHTYLHVHVVLYYLNMAGSRCPKIAHGLQKWFLPFLATVFSHTNYPTRPLHVTRYPIHTVYIHVHVYVYRGETYIGIIWWSRSIVKFQSLH